MRIMSASACKPDASELPCEINDIAKLAETGGFVLGNRALKLHAIEALNCAQL